MAALVPVAKSQLHCLLLDPPLPNGSGEQQDLLTDSGDSRKPCHYLHGGLREGYITVLPKLYASILNKDDFIPVYTDGEGSQRSALDHDSHFSAPKVQPARFVPMSRFLDDPVATAKDNEHPAGGPNPAQAATSIMEHTMRATDSLDRAVREGSAPLRPMHRPRPPLAQPFRPSPLRQSYRPSRSASSSKGHGGDVDRNQDSSACADHAGGSAMDGRRLTATYGDEPKAGSPVYGSAKGHTEQWPGGQERKNAQTAATRQVQGTSNAYPAVLLESGSVSGSPSNDKSSAQSLGNDQLTRSQETAAATGAAPLSAPTVSPQSYYGGSSQTPEVTHHPSDHTTEQPEALQLQQQYAQPASHPDRSPQPLSSYWPASTEPQFPYMQQQCVQQPPTATTSIIAPDQPLRIQAADGQWYYLTPMASSAESRRGIYEGLTQDDDGSLDNTGNHELERALDGD